MKSEMFVMRTMLVLGSLATLLGIGSLVANLF